VLTTGPTGVVAMLGPVEGIGQFTWISRDGRVLETVGPPASQLGVELSPDQQQLATFRSGEIWTMNLARPVPNRVTQGGGNRHPIWSPDGARILSLFQGRGIGTFDLMTTSVTKGDVETVRQAANAVKPSDWTRDGRSVWIEAGAAGVLGSSILMKSGDGQPVTIVRDSATIFEARVSPDGRWVAYASNRSGRSEIEVSSFPEFGQRHAVSLEGGSYPRWRADGRELYFLSPDGRLMTVTFGAGDPPVIGAPTPLFEVKLNTHPDRWMFAPYAYDVSADGSRFLINRLVSPAEESLSVIVSWSPPR